MSEQQRPAAHLADIMCLRRGKKEGIPTPPKYWSLPEWKSYYKHQILAANRLLKIYPFEVIVAAINNKKCNWIYSLFYPGLNQVLEEENARYERRLKIEEHNLKKEIEREEIKEITSAPQILQNNSSLRHRLD